MAAETKTSVAARFANHAYVSAADFSTLIDSYQDAHSVLLAISTAAQAGSKGLVYVSGSATVTFQSAAAQGLRLLNTATTAAAQQQMGGGTVGRLVFEAITTASSQQQLGGGTVGRTIFETATTAAAQAIVGGGASAATQAAMEAGAATDVFATPANVVFHPAMPKAWINFSGVTTASVRSSYNITSVARNGTGDYSIVFTVPFSNALYCYTGHSDEGLAGNNAPRNINQVGVSAGGLRILMTDATPTANDCELIQMAFYGDR
jgi:hypothetical protein